MHLIKRIQPVYWLSALSGVLLSLSFPNLSLSSLAWIGLIPLLFAIQDKSLAESAKLGFISGLFFFSILLYCIFSLAKFDAVIYVVAFLLFGYLALFVVLFSVLVRWLDMNFPKRLYLWVPLCWTMSEYLRGLGVLGFPWGLLGLSQGTHQGLIQMCSITGILGLTFVIAGFNGILATILIRWKSSHRLVLSEISICTVYILLINAITIWGYLQLNHPPLPGNKLKASIVQGNIPQDLKWSEEKEKRNYEKHLRLAQSVLIDKPDIIVFPETAVTDVWEGREDFRNPMIQLSTTHQVYLLTGAITGETDYSEYFNSILLIEPDGTYKQSYSKTHLVPFGEYIPLEGVFPFLRRLNLVPSHFSPGTTLTIFKAVTRTNIPYQLGTLICFESLIPVLSRNIKNNGADILVIVTNDSWFGKTSAPYQHNDIARIRAIENRIPIIRAANTGYSCFIDPYGRILKGLDIYRDGTLTSELPLTRQSSFYSRHGDWVSILCGVSLVLALFRTRRRFHPSRG